MDTVTGTSYSSLMNASTNPTPINTTHCRICGSTDYEDVGQSVLQETEGYSACCNKWVADFCEDQCHHD